MQLSVLHIFVKYSAFRQPAPRTQNILYLFEIVKYKIERAIFLTISIMFNVFSS